MKDNVFMTPIMSHQVRQFIQGVIVLAHMWEEKGSCVPSTQEKIGRISFSFPSFVVVLKAWKEEKISLQRVKKKLRGKPLEGVKKIEL